MTRSLLTLAARVRAGLGLTFMAEIVLPQLNLEGFRPPRVADFSPTRQIGVATVRGRPLRPAAQAFVKLLRSPASQD